MENVHESGFEIQKYKIRKHTNDHDNTLASRHDNIQLCQPKQFPTKKGDDRKNKAEGSLLVAREKYGLGSVVKKAISKAMQASKSTSKEAYPGEAGDIRDIEEFEKILSTPNKDAIFFSKEKLNALKKDIDAQDAYAEMLGEFVAVRQQDDEIIKMAEALNYGPKKTKSILIEVDNKNINYLTMIEALGFKLESKHKRNEEEYNYILTNANRKN